MAISIRVIYPKHLDYWAAYWYLSSLFVCLMIIKILAIFISSRFILCFFSIIILSLIPFQCFEKTFFMIPFLWVGYALRYTIDRFSNISVAILLTVLYGILYYYWDIRYSIYISPFHIWDVDVNSLFSLLYRFLIGAVAGVALILWFRIGLEYQNIQWMKRMVRYGKYTLVFYTMSFVLNVLIARFIWHLNLYVVSKGLIDLASFTVTVIMMVVMYLFQKRVERHKILALILLGFNYHR